MFGSFLARFWLIWRFWKNHGPLGLPTSWINNEKKVSRCPTPMCKLNLQKIYWKYLQGPNIFFFRHRCCCCWSCCYYCCYCCCYCCCFCCCPCFYHRFYGGRNDGSSRSSSSSNSSSSSSSSSICVWRTKFLDPEYTKFFAFRRFTFAHGCTVADAKAAHPEEQQQTASQPAISQYTTFNLPEDPLDQKVE